MKKNARGERRRLAEIINEGLDIPADVVPSGTLITIRAGSAVSVTGARGIILYSPTEIRLATKDGAISVRGRRLVCTSYHPSGLEIGGCILSVELEEEKDGTL